jgi:hypothetical protein
MRLTALFLIPFLSTAANAGVVIGPGLDVDAGSESVDIPTGMIVGVIDGGSGRVHLRERSGAERIDTGSGSVRLGREAVVAGDIDTGSGSVTLGEGAQAGPINTGSGSVELDDGASIGGVDTGSGSVRGGRAIRVAGDIDTGSGSVRLDDGSQVDGKIDTGSGDVDLKGTEVGGVIDVGSGDTTLIDSSARGIRTTSGDVRLSGRTRIDGDLIVRKQRCWGLCWGDDPVIVVDAGVEIAGKIIVEEGADATVRIDPAARVGGIVGATVAGIVERNP